MTEKQKYAIKLAINTMDKHFGRHCNTVYGNRKTGVTVWFGEAINILSDMVTTDNDSKQTNADRIRNMSDEELAEFLCKVKSDYQWMEHEFPSEEEHSEWEEWLQSEAEQEIT